MTLETLTRPFVDRIRTGRAPWARFAVVAGALSVFAASLPPVRASSRQDAPSIRQLSDDVKDPDAKVRARALNALSTKGAEALEPLSRLVGDPVRGIRSDAITAVLAIYVQPPPKKRVQSAENAFEWARYRSSPWPVPPLLVTNLVHDLSDDWPSIRRDAVYALGVVLTPPIDPALGAELMFSLADPDGSVRLAAAKAVGRLGVTQAGDRLIGLIGDPVLAVRLASMRSLGDIRETRALVALQEQFEFYRSSSAGRAALDALARIAHPSSAALFAEQRVSDNDALRRHAYEGLARLGSISQGDATVFETRLGEERHPEVIGAIAFALASAGRPHLDRIVQAVADRDTADQALEYLVELGRAHPDVLVPYLQNPNPEIREHVVMALGVVGGPGVESALTPLTSDSDEGVRRVAEVAVMRTRAPVPHAAPR